MVFFDVKNYTFIYRMTIKGTNIHFLFSSKIVSSSSRTVNTYIVFLVEIEALYH